MGLGHSWISLILSGDRWISQHLDYDLGSERCLEIVAISL